MKLVRYGQLGHEKPGILDQQGNIRDISAFVTDITASSLGNVALMDQLKALDLNLLDVVDKDTRIGACVGLPGKVICVGFNSKLHATEMGIPITNTSIP